MDFHRFYSTLAATCGLFHLISCGSKSDSYLEHICINGSNSSFAHGQSFRQMEETETELIGTNIQWILFLFDDSNISSVEL